MIGTAIHLPPAELHRFALATDREATHFEWARFHLASGCTVCKDVVESATARAPAAPALTLPDWIRPRRVYAASGVRAGMLADTSTALAECGSG